MISGLKNRIYGGYVLPNGGWVEVAGVKWACLLWVSAKMLPGHLLDGLNTLGIGRKYCILVINVPYIFVIKATLYIRRLPNYCLQNEVFSIFLRFNLVCRSSTYIHTSPFHLKNHNATSSISEKYITSPSADSPTMQRGRRIRCLSPFLPGQKTEVNW